VLTRAAAAKMTRVSDPQIEFLERCAAGEGAALGEGAFSPGPAVWVGKREVAHFDGPSTLDVRLTREVIRSRRSEFKSDERVKLRASSSDWLELELQDSSDVEWARRLVRDAIAANAPTAPPGAPPEGSDLERRRRFH